MALSARPAGMTSAPSASSGRVPSGARPIASMVGSPIDEIISAAELQANTRFNFHGYSDWTNNQQNPDRQPLANTASRFETFSTTFINLLDRQQHEGASGGAVVEAQPAHQNFVAKAIEAYEGTSSVIHGQSKNLGNSLSISM